MPLEIACFSALSATAAARAGAARIELCASYSAGGVTPSLSTLRTVRDELRSRSIRIPVHVMIRPRGGCFTYSAAELRQMKRSIEEVKAVDAADGFVFGVLTASSAVDEVRCRELVDVAAPLPCTFHRAIDQARDLDAAVEAIVGCGFTSILTSGGASSAMEGRERVAELQKRFGGRVSIVLGGGVRSSNVGVLSSETGVEWLHSAAITGSDEEVDEGEVREMIKLLQVPDEDEEVDEEDVKAQM